MRVIIDPSVVRGLEYYTGPVYEAELTFDVTNEKGEKVVFGSVGGGGRYDGSSRASWASRFGHGLLHRRLAPDDGAEEPRQAGRRRGHRPRSRDSHGRRCGCHGSLSALHAILRNEGIRAEMYQGNWKKFGNQLKYADRRNCPIAIIQGGDERAQGVCRSRT